MTQSTVQLESLQVKYGGQLALPLKIPRGILWVEFRWSAVYESHYLSLGRVYVPGGEIS